MAEQSIDRLSIEISATTTKAVKNIDKLSESLNRLGSTLSKNINSTKLDSVVKSFKELSQATRDFGKSTKAIENLPKLTTGLSQMAKELSKSPTISRDLVELASALSQIKSVSGAVNNAQSLSESVTGKTGDVREARKQTSELAENLEKVAQNEKKVEINAKSVKALSRTAGLLKKEFSGITDRIKALRGKFNGLSKSMSKSFKHNLTSLLRYYFGIRSLFVLTNRMRSAIEDGTKNLVKYSAEYNKTISQIMSGLGTVKNAMAVSIAPVVTYFQDAINELLDTLISAFNTLARLFAKLTGARQVVQATRYYEDYAQSLGSASKNAKDLTTGIDELNILNDKSGGGGGSGFANVQDMFKTIDVDNEFSGVADMLKDAIESGDFSAIGNAVADKISESLQNINWETIRGKAKKWGKGLATFLNGVAEEELNGKSFGRTIGETIGQGVNTGIDFAYEFVSNFHWKSWGKMIADGLKGALETIEWKKLGTTLSKLCSGLLDYWITIFNDDKLWQDLGKAIGEFFSGIEWKNNWFKLKELAKAIVNAMKNALISWAQTDASSLAVATGIGAVIMGLKVADLVAKINGTTLGAVIGKAILEAIKKGGGLSVLDIGLSAMLSDTISNLLNGKDLAGNVRPKKGESPEEYTKRNYESKYGEGSYEKMLKDQEEFAKKYEAGWQTIKDAFANADLFGEIKKSYEENFSPIPDNLKLAIDNMKNNMSTGWSQMKTDTSTNWEQTKTDLLIKWDTIKSNAQSKFETIKSEISTKWSSTKTDTSNKWTNIKTDLASKWTNMKTDASTKFTQLKENVIGAFNGIKNGLRTPINAIIGFVESMVNRIVDGFNSVADSIKQLTTFSWTNPLTKETHSSDGINLPRMSHVSIPRLAQGGFVPNTNMGSLFWAGESGAEIVANAKNGTEVLNANQVSSAVSDGVRNAIVQAVVPYLTQILNSTQDIADKDFAVNLDDRAIARANARGQKLNGMSLIST